MKSEQTAAQAPQTAIPAPTAQANAEFKAQLKQQLKDIQSAVRDAEQEGTSKDVNGAPLRPVGVPIVGVPPVPPGLGNNDIPPQAVDIATGFFVMVAVIVIGWPLARALGRRIERKSEVAALSPGVSEQLQRIEQAVDTMAIEIERISESQRFMAKLQNAAPPELVALQRERV